MITLNRVSLTVCGCLLVFASFFSRAGLDLGVTVVPIHFIFIFVLLIGGLRFDTKVNVNEFLLLVFFMAFILTALKAEDYLRSIIMIFGIIFLMLYYIVSKSLLMRMSYEDFHCFVLKLGKIILFLSIFYYIVGVFGFLLFGIAEREHFAGVLVEKGIIRFIGISTDPNFMAFSSLFFVFLFLSESSRLSKVYGALYIVVIVLTLSRGGVVSLFFGLFFFILRYGFKYIIAFLTIGILSYFSLDVFLGGDVLLNVIDKRMAGLETGAGRVDIWGNALSLFKENYLFGIGIFQFQTYNMLYFNDYHYAHNTYLEIMVEGGVICSFLFFLFVSSLSYKCFKIYIEDKSLSWLFPAQISLFICIIGLTSYSNPLFYTFILLLNNYIYHGIKKK